MGDIKDVGSKDPFIGPIPVGGTDATSETGYIKTGASTRDQIEKSQAEPPPSQINCDKPKLNAPLSNFTLSANEVEKETKTNPWLANSYIAAFLAVMYEYMSQQSAIKWSDAERELSLRLQGLELATKSAIQTGEIAKLQAFEKMVQAISSFVTAGISGASAMETARNLGKAERYVNDKIKDHETNLKQAKETELKKTFPNDNDNEIKNKFDDPTTKYTSNEVKEAQKKYNKTLSSKEDEIRQRVNTANQISQATTEAFKQCIQGSSAAWQAQITLERGREEMIKGFMDGLIQALRTFRDTSSEAHSDAKQILDNVSSMISRTIESTGRAHSLKQGG
jgi:uncharacterized linocin/CFP29 family protein